MQWIDELVVALHRMDKVNGRAYGGQAIEKSSTVKFTASALKNGTGTGKGSPTIPTGFVSAVGTPTGATGGGDTLPSLPPTHDWLGARHLCFGVRLSVSGYTLVLIVPYVFCVCSCTGTVQPPNSQFDYFFNLLSHHTLRCKIIIIIKS